MNNLDLLKKETCYERFIKFCKPLNVINENDTNIQDAIATCYFNPQCDAVSCKITKIVKPNHIRIYKDENGLSYYEHWLHECGEGSLSFISLFEIMNSKGDVEYDFVHSALPQKYKLKERDAINCYFTTNYKIPMAIRFTFKGEPYPIQYSFTGYIFQLHMLSKFSTDFGNDMFFIQ